MIQAREAIQAVRRRQAPDRLRAAAPTVSETFDAFAAYAGASSEAIYGANTLPGHNDDKRVSAEALRDYQRNLLESHAIGDAPWFDAGSVRAMTLAKAVSVSHGATPIHPERFIAMLDAIEDADFHPRIPLEASYSSGDVIPGAHWALALIERAPGPLGPGEGMALMNGEFIHLGAGLRLAQELEELWRCCLLVQRVSLRLMDADHGAFTAGLGSGVHPAAVDAIRYIGEGLQRGARATQDPVSFRTVCQQVEALAAGLADFGAALDLALSRPSENPLFIGGRHCAHGGFVEPLLTVRTGAVIETLLVQAWMSNARLTHLLSGRRAGLPPEAACEEDALGLIQWPKLSRAILEDSRRDAGVRAFASGSSTSHDIEDFSSFGLRETRSARRLCSRVFDMLAIELTSAVWLARQVGRDLPTSEEFAMLNEARPGGLKEARSVLSRAGEAGAPEAFQPH